MVFSPIDRVLVDGIKNDFNIDPAVASIREMKHLVDEIEKQSGTKFLKMEFGIPGIKSDPIGIEGLIAEMKTNDYTHIYPPFDGIPELKKESANFVKLFMGIEVSPSCCVPTVGAMQGCFISIAIAGRMNPGKDTILFLDPGFPVNKIQTKVLGLKSDSIDLINYRGNELIKVLEEKLSQNKIGGILYSNPNNPSWVIFSEEELKGIGELCDKYDCIAIEDLAYFGMDFRKDYSVPGQAPYQPTIARYTDLFISLISSSKIFSFAGERAGFAVISPKMFGRKRSNLVKYFNTDDIGHAFVHGGIYPTTSGVPQSSQRGLYHLLKAVNEGKMDLLKIARIYGERAKVMKKIFLDNGFYLVYENDLGEPLADGFYFTIAYPGMDSDKLVNELLYYGISAISLKIAGSIRNDGIRACVSLISESDFDELRSRVERFNSDHG